MTVSNLPVPIARAALLALCLTTPALPALAATPVRYDADADHSQLGFTAKYMGVVDVQGRFSDFRGTLIYVPDDPSRTTVNVVIDAVSLDTGNKTRDKDLRGPDFFDSARFPKLRFSSTRTEKRGDGFAMTGDLTIRNVTKPVTLAVERIHPEMKDALGATRIGFVGRTVVNRLDFGVVGSKFWNNEFAPGRFAIGDSVRIELVFEAKIEDLERQAPAASRKRPYVDSLVAIARTRGAQAAGRSLRDARSASTYDLSANALLLAAGRLLQSGTRDAAVEVLRQAAEMYPNSADVQALLAEAHMGAGQREAAIQAGTRALALDPWQTSARETLRWMKGD